MHLFQFIFHIILSAFF